MPGPQPDLEGLPLVAAALQGLEATVLDVVPTCGDKGLGLQAIVQVGELVIFDGHDDAVGCGAGFGFQAW